VTTPLLDDAGLDRLRAALTAADYTPDGIAALLGPVAGAALDRGDLLAVRPTAAGDDPLPTLLRLFAAGGHATEAAAKAALAPLDLADAYRIGLLEGDGDRVRAGLDVRPYGDDDLVWWVLSDLGSDVRPGPLRPDHVLGVGGASVTLAQATVRPPVATALDLGTGCGVQALHLSRHAGAVTATDVNPRALRLAATTAALNGLRWELLEGDLAAPVAGRRFDLVVCNPPFVVGPGTTTHAYRDSGRPGDAVSAEVIAAAPRLLTDGGWAQLLANWVHVDGESWEERVAGWLAGTGCDGWVIQREVLDPGQYVSLWMRDAGESAGGEGDARAAAWLEWFAAHRIEAVGFGLVTLRAGGATDPVVHVEEAWQAMDSPIGPEVQAWFERQDWLRSADLAGARLVTAPPLRLTQSAARGGDGWDVDKQVIALDGGLRWAEEVDPITVALLGGCDGSLPLRDQLRLLAAAYEADPDALLAAALPRVAHLVERGMLLPAGDGAA
jgi:methylase of polypeptide subunit release factors